MMIEVGLCMANFRLIARIAILTFTAVTMAAAQEKSETQLAITNVRVFTGERLIEKAVVTVKSGKIVSIAADAPAARSLTIDGSDMTALPGLIDAHVHLLWVGTMSEAEVLAFMEDGLQKTLQAYLRHGVTTIFSVADPTELILRTRRELRDGTRAGPRLLCVGPAFTARGGHPAVTFCRGSDWCRATVAAETDSEEGARREVRRLAGLDVDAIKLVNQGGRFMGKIPLAKLKPEVMQAIVAEARSKRLPVLAHIWDESDALEALAAGASLAHMPNGPLSSDALLQALMNPERFVVTTFDARKRQGARAQTLMKLHKAGVQLVMGSDTGPVPPGVPGERLPGESTIREIEALVEGGLSPAEALKASTSVAARLVGLEDEIGKLEPGMSADILLVRGNPLQTIADLGRVEAVIQAGKVVFRPER